MYYHVAILKCENKTVGKDYFYILYHAIIIVC